MGALKCDICGGSLSVDAGGKTGTCNFCGTEHSLERMREKIQEIRGTVKIDGVVTVQGISTKEELLKNAETYLELNQYNRAENTFEEIIKKYPTEPEGWMGVFKATIMNPQVSFHKIVDCYHRYVKTAFKLIDNTAAIVEYKRLMGSFVEEYGKNLHIREDSEEFWNTVAPKDLELIMYSELNYEEIPALKLLREKICQNYYEAFKNGEITFFDYVDPSNLGYHTFWQKEYHNIPALKLIVSEGYENAEKINQKNEFMQLHFLKGILEYASLQSKPFPYGTSNVLKENWWATCINSSNTIYNPNNNDKRSELKENAQLFNWHKFYNIVFLLGNTMIVKTSCYYGEGDYDWVYIILQFNKSLSIEEVCFNSLGKRVFGSARNAENVSKTQERISNWKENGKCSFCGSDFKSNIFGTKCVKCGKKKDY